MSDEQEPGFQMQRVYPDTPPPTQAPPAAPPTQHRKDDPEESLLGTFIQWVGCNKKKPARKPKGKGKGAKTSKSSTNAAASSVPLESGQKERRDKKERKKEKKERADKDKRPDNNDVTESSDRGCHGNETTLNMDNPAFKNVHLSRPSTPQLTEGYSDLKSYDPDGDKYRLMYLTVRIEQQIKHVTNVLKTMIANKVKIVRIGSMLKVGEALHQFRSQLKGVRKGSAKTMRMFKSIGDLQEFFDAIEAVCCSVEGIPIEDPVVSEDLKTMIRKEVKETHVEACERKQKQELERRKAARLAAEAEKAAEGKKVAEAEMLIDLERVCTKLREHPERRLRENMKQIRREREQADGSPSNNYRHQRNKQKHKKEKDGNHNNSLIPRQRNAKSHNAVESATNDVTNVVMENQSDKEANISRDRKFTEQQVSLNLGPKSNVTAQAKRALYKDAKQLQDSGVFPCTDGLDDFDFDSDEEKEKLKAQKKKKTDLSKLQALNKGQQQKDEEYDSLMAEIDSLMADTDIQPAKTTFEELMAGKNGSSAGRMRKTKDQLVNNDEGANSQRTKSHGKKSARNSEQFIESLDNLLDECEHI